MSHPYDAELIAKREAELKRELQERIDAKIAEAKEAVDCCDQSRRRNLIMELAKQSSIEDGESILNVLDILHSRM